MLTALARIRMVGGRNEDQWREAGRCAAAAALAPLSSSFIHSPLGGCGVAHGLGRGLCPQPWRRYGGDGHRATLGGERRTQTDACIGEARTPLCRNTHGERAAACRVSPNGRGAPPCAAAIATDWRRSACAHREPHTQGTHTHTHTYTRGTVRAHTISLGCE